MAVKIEKIENIAIDPNSEVSVKEMGNTIEITYTQHRNTEQRIQRLDKDHYLILATGEVVESKHINNRSESKKELSKSFKNLRELINTNIIDIDKCKSVVFTYEENMTDTKRLHNDFKQFMTRFRRRYGTVEYIAAREPQGRGAWHIHSIFIFPSKAPFIPNEDMAKVWKHGFTETKKIDENIDNLGAYLTAHLSDMPLKEVDKLNIDYNDKDLKIIYDNDNKISKAIVKGARLKFYPPGFNIYVKSTGIKKPTKENMSYCEIKEKIGPLQPTYSETMQLSDEDKNFTSIITREQYNTKRKKKNEAGL